MKNLILLLAGTVAYSLSAKRTRGAADRSKTLDQPALISTIKTACGDTMYLSECKENDVTYGVISFNLKEGYPDLEDARQVLEKFMSKVQFFCHIQHTTGITAESTAAARTLTDYWQDVESRDWKVKGWTDGNTLSLFYIKNIGQLPVALEDQFFDGLGFAA